MPGQQQSATSSIRMRILVLVILIVVALMGLLVAPVRMQLSLLKGDIEASLGWKQIALSDYESAISADAGCYPAILKAGILLNERGDRKQAVKYFESLRRSPSFRRIADEHLTDIALDCKAYARALTYASDWVKLAPSDSRAYRMKGQALARLGRSDAAIASFNECLRLDPKSDAAVDRDQLITRVGSLEDAAARVFAPNLEARTDNFDALMRDAVRLIAGDERDQAVSALTMALKLRPDASAFGLRGRLHFDAGRYKEAATDFEQCEKLAGVDKTVELKTNVPEFAMFSTIPTTLQPFELAFYRGASLGKLKEYPDSLKFLNRALALQSDYAPAYNARAEIYEQLHQDRLARSDRDKAKLFASHHGPESINEVLEQTIRE